MRVFVTGASGFVGTHLVRRLIREGFQVVALARTADSAALLQQQGCATLIGDLLTINKWSHHLSTMDAVVHAAAPVKFWGDWEQFEQEIVVATLALYRAANHAGVGQFVHISTEAVLQDEKPLLDITEAEPYPLDPNSIYGRAKKMAEIRLRQSNLETRLTLLRPSFIWGSNCPALAQLCERVRQKRFTWVDGGRSAFERVHVDNLVQAIYLALRRYQDGLYLVTDDAPGSFREFFQPLFESQGLQPGNISVPSFLLKPFASASEFAWQTLNRKTPPPLTRFELAFVSQPRRYDISHIRRELKYEPITNTATGLANLRVAQ